MILVSADEIDAAARLRAFEAEAGDAGAVVSFSGLVRPSSGQGDMKILHLQAYSPMTENGIEAAMAEAKDRWPLSNAVVVHRIGDMRPGETIVFVATASKHRRAAFEAADFLMDYLKTKAVFWKREKTESTEVWIEPRDEDYADATRWEMEEVN
jgi:molybdopterin synthase catalytic subunit